MRSCGKSLILALCGFMSIPGAAQDIVVSSPLSLKPALMEAAQVYSARTPQVHISWVESAFDRPSSPSAERGSVDIVLSASPSDMESAAEHHVIAPNARRPFMQNKLILVVSARSQIVIKGVEGLLGQGDLTLAIPNPHASGIGPFAREALEVQGLWKSLERRIVYRPTSMRCAEDLKSGDVEAAILSAPEALQLGDSIRVVCTMPTKSPLLCELALAQYSREERAAKAFMAFLATEESMAIFARWGLVRP